VRSPRALFRRPIGRSAFFVFGVLVFGLLWSGPPATVEGWCPKEQVVVASPPRRLVGEAMQACKAGHDLWAVGLDPRRDPENGFVGCFPSVGERGRGPRLFEAGHGAVGQVPEGP
jgi:hypothetical protein